VISIGPLEPGLTGHATLVVEDGHTAAAVGSGLEHVLATPVMIALMEQAAVDCVEHRLEPGTASLGVRIAVDHSAPSNIGAEVTASAELIEAHPKKLVFRVTARDTHGPVGSGEHVRAVVAVEDFRHRLARRTEQT
jgi:fluoroacetyl-CoA thioesterase